MKELKFLINFNGNRKFEIKTFESVEWKLSVPNSVTSLTQILQIDSIYLK